ncbi:MAG: sigma factor-like helix-turn-helix DNA-binding protein [Prochloraceae cyanobacterium]
MGRPRKHPGLYGRNEAYFKTEKGKEALKRYQTSDKKRTVAREWARKKRGTIVDRRQWFIDTYGDIETALALLEPDQRASIELYYGLSGEKPLNQEEVGEKLGKSGSTICRLIKAAKEKLEPLKENVHNCEQN